MNLDDETRLSAYLDGELEPGERLEVEAALLSDPALAGRLRALERVCELVGGLPHPAAPFDLAGELTARLRARRRRRPAAWLRAHPWRAGAFATAAAAVLGVLLIPTTGGRPARPAARPAPATVARATPAPPAAPKVRRERPDATARAAPAASGVATAPAAAGGDATRLGDWLDSPNLTRCFLVTDVVGGKASEQVGKLVEDMPRLDPSFGRLTIAQGIVIDPKHPGAATVFALVLNDQELKQFRDELRRSFPDGYEERAPDPEMVTQLAQIGDVAVLPGKAVAALEAPAEAQGGIAALKSRPGDRPDAEDEGPTPEQYLSAPAQFVRRQQGGPAPPAVAPRREGTALDRVRRQGANLVLVWVASR